MKPLSRLAALAAFAALWSLPAQAADGGKPDLSGAWRVRGVIFSDGAPVAALAPVCQLRQEAARLSGACKGPNSEGAAEGTVAGAHVVWQWRAAPTTAIGMNGAASFEGDLGADGVIRGRWTFAGLPGLSGDFSQQREP